MIGALKIGLIGAPERKMKEGEKDTNRELSLDYTGFNITDEHPIFYKGVDSRDDDFFLLHAYTPEHFTLLTFISVTGIVTTHFSTITNKHDLYEIILKSSYNYKKIRPIPREEYLRFKNIYDNHVKSVQI